MGAGYQREWVQLSWLIAVGVGTITLRNRPCRFRPATSSAVVAQIGRVQGTRGLVVSLLGVVYRAGVKTPASVLRHIGQCQSPLGPLVLAVSDTAVRLVEFCEADVLDQRMDELQRRHAATLQASSSGLLAQLQQQLQEYFQDRRSQFDLPLATPGSVFQQQVWQALQQIPYGRTCSYVDVARQLNDPRAARAVGRANRANPIALLIPCHRVINADGEVGGYDGGTWRKRALLEMERGQRQGTLNL